MKNNRKIFYPEDRIRQGTIIILSFRINVLGLIRLSKIIFLRGEQVYFTKNPD
jgi:hypothetical protein